MATNLLELAIDLPPKGSREVIASLTRQLKRAILDGRLKAGLRLPASRLLAQSLGISRNTVVAAYDLLLNEGVRFSMSTLFPKACFLLCVSAISSARSERETPSLPPSI